MKKLLFFGLVFITSSNLFAQMMDGGWAVFHSGYAAESRGIARFGILNSTTADVAWSVAYDGSGNHADISAVAYTNDGGITWTAYDPVNLPGAVNLGISMVFPTDVDTAYLAGNKRNVGDAGIWKTTDAGATWSRVSTNSMYSNPYSYCNIVYFVDANNGFTQGDPINGEFEMYYTTDGGATWTAIPGSDIADPLPGEYGNTGGVVHAGSTYWFSTNKGRLYKSTDNGHTWNTVYPTFIVDNVVGHYTVTFKDDNEGWLLRGNSELYHTTDGGATWTLMVTTGLNDYGGEITYVPVEDMLVVVDADQNHAGAAYSTDGGATWTRMLYYDFGDNGADGSWEMIDTSDPANQIQHTCVAFRDIDFGLSGGFSHRQDPNDPNSEFTQGVFKYLPYVAIPSVAGQTIKGLHIYPNPATGLVNVTTENAAISNIAIYDITGKEVINMNNLSLNNTSINVSNLQRGIYVMKIEDKNNAKQAVKLVLK